MQFATKREKETKKYDNMTKREIFEKYRRKKNKEKRVQHKLTGESEEDRRIQSD